MANAVVVFAFIGYVVVATISHNFSKRITNHIGMAIAFVHGMIKYLYAFFVMYSCHAVAANLPCAPQSLLDKVDVESRSSYGYFPIYKHHCNEIAFSEVDMDGLEADVDELNQMAPQDCRSYIWAMETVEDKAQRSSLRNAYRECMKKASEQKRLKDSFSKSTFSESVPNLPSGKYVMDIYYLYTGAWRAYAKKYYKYNSVYAVDSDVGWNSQTIFSSYPISSESNPIKIWPFLYQEKFMGSNEMGSYVEAPRSPAPTLQRDYKGPDRYPYKIYGKMLAMVPGGGGVSDIPDEYVSYDVDSVQFQFNDSKNLTFSEFKHSTEHQRRPYTYYGKPHDEAIRTIAKIALWVDASDLRSHCENLKSRRESEMRVKEILRQGLTLMKMHASEGDQSLISSLRGYFEDTERGLDMAIETLEKNGSSMGPQAKILQEHLQALSILKKHSCLRAWTMDKILSNASGFGSAVNACKSQKNIPAPEAQILLSIFQNLQHENERTLASMKSFNEGLRNYSLQLTEGDMRLEKIKMDYEQLKNWMTNKSSSQAVNILHQCAFD